VGGVETMAPDKISDHPCTPVSIVVEIDQAVVGYNIGAAENDAVIATSAMIIISGIHHRERVSQI
jgi:hypothetical protein